MYMDMRFQVGESASLWGIQEQFSRMFPFLKLEFFRSLNGAQKALSRNDSIKSTDITINRNMTVSVLEEEFRKKAGVNVQVLRKSGNVWIATSLTNEWTLEQQNKEGESLSD
jgi:hypothetical protein